MRFAKICSVIVVISLVAVLFVGLSTPAAAMTWVGGKLDSTYWSSSIAVDSTGAPKICYHLQDGLKYTEWIHGTSTTPGHWSDPVWIDHTANVGTSCHIALYPSGDPAVVYYDGNNHVLRFAWRNPAGVWEASTLDSGADVGRYCSIAIGTDGREHICYLDYTNHALKYAEWISAATGWDIRTIASNVVGSCSIALDNKNNPEISYMRNRGGAADLMYDLMYIKRVGGTWRPEELVYYGERSLIPVITSIADNQADRSTAGISYYYGTISEGVIKYAERNPTTGTWSITTIGSNDGFSSLAFDKSKLPVISYTGVGAGNYVLKFAYRDAAGWHKQTVDDGGSAHANVGGYPSLAIGSNNVPSISYNDDTNDNLKYVEGHADATAMTCTISASSVVLNQAFTVKGKLTSNGAVLSKEEVHLERRAKTGSTWGAWATVAGTSQITPAGGTVSSTQKLSKIGTYQYRWNYAGSIAYKGSYSPAVTVSAAKAQTTATITASDTTPAVNQKVTFTAKLYWWNPATRTWAALSGKPVTIWHSYKGKHYNDVTNKKTVAGKITFVQKFGSAGVRYYYATFAGDSTYAAKTTSVLTITVQ